MAKKLATLLKEARTGAGLTQTALAEEVDGMSASDIGKAERGEKVPTQAQLKQIAKATGVTQTSLIEASKSASAKKTTTSAKSSSAKSSSKTSTAKKSSTAKKTSSSKTSSSTKSSVTLSASEKTMLEAYRAADSDTRKLAVKILKGEKLEIGELLPTVLGGVLSNFIG